MRRHAPQYPEAVKHLAPGFFRNFACAAGACPDSCCRAGWEIVVDPETLEKYASLPGEEGDRIRAALKEGAEVLLRQDEDRVCVLLDGDGLCHAQRCFGHGSLCRVCREYPRFHREFGGLTEHGLSLSCPTAFRLAAETKPSWDTWEDEGPVVPNDLDPEVYLPLREGRQLALGILAEEGRPFWDRLELVWALARRLQRGLDGETRIGKAALRRLSSPIGQKAVLRNARRYFGTLPWPGLREGCLMEETMQLPRWVDTFAELEILSPAWGDELQALRRRLETGELPDGYLLPDRPEVYSRYLWCSLFKYWLDAADDGQLLPRVRRSLAMTLLGLAMDRVLPAERSHLQRISREIEHCEENLEALLQKL